MSKRIDASDMFVMDGRRSIMAEEHFGIGNGRLTANVTFQTVASLKGLYAPPYASSDFYLGIRAFEEKISTEEYQWDYSEVRRSGKLKEISFASTTTLVPGTRGLVLTVSLRNQGGSQKDVPIQCHIKGGLDYVRFWEFLRPTAEKESFAVYNEESKRYSGGYFIYYQDKHLLTGKKIIKYNDAGAIVIGTDLEGLKWDDGPGRWATTISLGPKETRTFHLILTIGDHKQANDDCNALLADPRKTVLNARRENAKAINGIFDKLPRLEASDERLVKFYNRSLLPFLQNRWQVPEFVLQPLYTTGAINGGCVCCYLWDFGEICEILSLYDPVALREHIRQFLKADISAHFSFNAVTGVGWGPLYQVNQEKVIFLIRSYVLHTGDVAFLDEEVNGKTVLQWAVEQATFRDDLKKPGILVDYGVRGRQHLELWVHLFHGKYKYEDYMPDLNGRRYANYMAVNELCILAGKKAGVDCVKRAAVIKKLMKDKMWSRKDKWFCNLESNGNKYVRYVSQMYYLLGSGVLDKEEEAGLLSHLNEREFLSDFGMHSMTKTDPMYNQRDIDCGGGGSFISFPMHIMERLYLTGHPEMAEDILKRILWLGERLPYWGDSQVANFMDYRRDTPLQGSVAATSAAQNIIFGMFGLRVKLNGDVVVNPQPPKFSPRIALKQLRVRGLEMDIDVTGKKYTVKVGKRVIRANTGQPVTIPAGK